jgi:hypothetical protein
MSNRTNSPSHDHQHRTDDLAFSAYLITSRKLRFIACERNNAGRIDFVFADPHHEGDRHHFDFDSGAECSAATFYEKIRHLRRIMDRTASRSTESNEHARHSR